jgi:hypothetical protein
MGASPQLPQPRSAGCRRPLGDGETLALGDGNRVHLDDLNCLLQHGERWRCAARNTRFSILRIAAQR